jgi:hypothetical protein
MALDEEAHSGVEPADRPGPGGGEVVVALRQPAQHGVVVLEGHLSQPAVAQGHDGSGAGVVSVGLVAVVVVEQPHPGGHLRRHVDHRLTGGASQNDAR